MATHIKESTITSKGQITIPAEWRRRFGSAKKVSWVEHKGKLQVEPVVNEEDSWVTIFDAERDNKGKGIDGYEFLAMLEKGL